MKAKGRTLKPRNGIILATGVLLSCAVFVGSAFGQAGLTRITLEQAIELAIKHNHNLLAARTVIQQDLAQEITANLRRRIRHFSPTGNTSRSSCHPAAFSITSTIPARATSV